MEKTEKDQKKLLSKRQFITPDKSNCDDKFLNWTLMFYLFFLVCFKLICDNEGFWASVSGVFQGLTVIRLVTKQFDSIQNKFLRLTPGFKNRRTRASASRSNG